MNKECLRAKSTEVYQDLAIYLTWSGSITAFDIHCKLNEMGRALLHQECFSIVTN